MANAIITFKVMPESPEVDFEKITSEALEIAKNNGSKGEMQSKIEPLAFGLKQILIYAMYEMSDDKDFDQISSAMAKIEGVSSAEIINMDLAMG
jgi:translation elongation factor aEF-1 beta